MIKFFIFSEGFKMYFSKEQPHWCTNITLTVRMKDLSTGLWWCRLHFIDYSELYSVSKVIHVRLITLQRYAKTLILLSAFMFSFNLHSNSCMRAAMSLQTGMKSRFNILEYLLAWVVSYFVFSGPKLKIGSVKLNLSDKISSH